MNNPRVKITFEVSKVFKDVVNLEGSKNAGEPSRLQLPISSLTLKVDEGKL